MQALRSLEGEDQITLARLARAYDANRGMTMTPRHEKALVGWGAISSKLLSELPPLRSLR